MIGIILIYYNIMVPSSYMRSVVDRNVIMRRMTVHTHTHTHTRLQRRENYTNLRHQIRSVTFTRTE